MLPRNYSGLTTFSAPIPNVEELGEVGSQSQNVERTYVLAFRLARKRQSAPRISQRLFVLPHDILQFTCSHKQFVCLKVGRHRLRFDFRLEHLNLKMYCRRDGLLLPLHLQSFGLRAPTIARRPSDDLL
jgi:hypothetical protein